MKTREAPVRRDELGAGTLPEVVRVHDHHARPRRADVLGRERLHGRLRPDRHEQRSRDFTVASPEHPGPREAARRLQFEEAHARLGIHIASP